MTPGAMQFTVMFQGAELRRGWELREADDTPFRLLVVERVELRRSLRTAVRGSVVYAAADDWLITRPNSLGRPCAARRRAL